MTVATRNKTDSQIQQDVIRELSWDTRVTETDVGIEVDDHVVTLTGTVPSYIKKIAAEEAAHRVAGVLDVANDIQVIPTGQKLTDTDIAKRVRSTLDWELFLPEDAVTSTVQNGWITLKGQVDSYVNRYDAVKAIRKIRGVRGVNNEIRVIPPETPSESQVREEVEGALDRQAMREATRLQVHVKDGAVVLEGKVRSWPERRAVIEAARYTHGVRSVDETSLKVDPFLFI